MDGVTLVVLVVLVIPTLGLLGIITYAYIVIGGGTNYRIEDDVDYLEDYLGCTTAILTKDGYLITNDYILKGE